MAHNYKRKSTMMWVSNSHKDQANHQQTPTLALYSRRKFGSYITIVQQTLHATSWTMKKRIFAHSLINKHIGICLALPPRCQICDVFHTMLLKPHHPSSFANNFIQCSLGATYYPNPLNYKNLGFLCIVPYAIMLAISLTPPWHLWAHDAFHTMLLAHFHPSSLPEC